MEEHQVVIPGWGKSLGGFIISRYSCLIPMDRGAHQGRLQSVECKVRHGFQIYPSLKTCPKFLVLKQHMTSPLDPVVRESAFQCKDVGLFLVWELRSLMPEHQPVVTHGLQETKAYVKKAVNTLKMKALAQYEKNFHPPEPASRCPPAPPCASACLTPPFCPCPHFPTSSCLWISLSPGFRLHCSRNKLSS